jgi:hypothetical protein
LISITMRFIAVSLTAAAWFIPVLNVPTLLVTHGLIFRLLLCGECDRELSKSAIA